MLQRGDKIVPSDWVKSFGDVQLQQEGRRLIAVEAACDIAHIQIVVMDVSAFYESAPAR
jgi:hypothetical protein